MLHHRLRHPSGSAYLSISPALLPSKYFAIYGSWHISFQISTHHLFYGLRMKLLKILYLVIAVSVTSIGNLIQNDETFVDIQMVHGKTEAPIWKHLRKISNQIPP
jgi:hypothetical protein